MLKACDFIGFKCEKYQRGLSDNILATIIAMQNVLLKSGPVDPAHIYTPEIELFYAFNTIRFPINP